LLVDEHRYVAGISEIDERGEIRRTSDSVIVRGRQIRDGGSEQRASETITDCVDLALIGCSFHNVQSSDWPFE
jgi:hypothetical protein